MYYLADNPHKQPVHERYTYTIVLVNSCQLHLSKLSVVASTSSRLCAFIIFMFSIHSLSVIA